MSLADAHALLDEAASAEFSARELDRTARRLRRKALAAIPVGTTLVFATPRHEHGATRTADGWVDADGRPAKEAWVEEYWMLRSLTIKEEA